VVGTISKLVFRIASVVDELQSALSSKDNLGINTSALVTVNVSRSGHVGASRNTSVSERANEVPSPCRVTFSMLSKCTWDGLTLDAGTRESFLMVQFVHTSFILHRPMIVFSQERMGADTAKLMSKQCVTRIAKYFIFYPVGEIEKCGMKVNYVVC
jgi:hypothetical protein